MIEFPIRWVPKAVAKAVVVVRDREADIAVAKANVEQAKAAIQEAIVGDRALFPGALDAGR